jgi:uncharacterized damage-inducible protein DinB
VSRVTRARSPARRRVTRPEIKGPPDAPAERKAPVRRAPDAPSERKGPVRRAPDAPSEQKPPASATARSFPQRGAASARQRVVFELMRARARVRAAVQGLGPAGAEAPLRPGGWTVRETTLHLASWDALAAAWAERLGQGERPPWQDARGRALDRLNRELLEPLRALSWEATLRRLERERRGLLDALDGLAAHPACWESGAPLAELLADIADNDHHHAGQIKRHRAPTPIEV